MKWGWNYTHGYFWHFMQVRCYFGAWASVELQKWEWMLHLHETSSWFNKSAAVVHPRTNAHTGTHDTIHETHIYMGKRKPSVIWVPRHTYAFYIILKVSNCCMLSVWGAMLQVRRSPVRVPMRSSNFSIYLIVPAALGPGVYSAYHTITIL
jgi:hypothetical protein